MTAPAAALLALLLGAAPAFAQTQSDARAALPVPPCAGQPLPDHPPHGAPPEVRVWFNEQVAGWQPPPCARLGRIDANAVVATAARFTNTMDSDAIAARVARVSNYRLVRYYSRYRERWRPMVKDAFALTEDARAFANPARHRREDFTEADLQDGNQLRYWVKDNSLLGGVVYRLSVRERTEDRLVFDIENETAMTFVVVDAVEPGAFRQLHIFEREEGERWRYYGMAALRIKWFRPSVQSFANRAESYFRHVAGEFADPQVGAAP